MKQPDDLVHPAWLTWVHTLLLCSRRDETRNTCVYVGDVSRSPHDKLYCQCPKCQQWRVADHLRDQYRLTAGLPI